MLETAYPTLASNLGLLYRQQGKVSGRVGNRHGGLALAPYNVYEAADGHVAIVCATEHHWHNILKAMGQEALKDDPRYSTNKVRVEHIDRTDAFVHSWTKTLTRAGFAELCRQHAIAAAFVGDLHEVMNDPHMHAMGALEWFDDPELGKVVLATSPILLHGVDRVATVASPALGQHNQEIYGGWLGLDDQTLTQLKVENVI